MAVIRKDYYQIMRILLIEDDKELCTAIVAQLKHEGYLIDVCNTGEDGLFYALKPIYELIILDRMLPIIDGLTILRTIRKKGLTTSIIIVTAMGSIDDRVDGLDNGADDYLVKPFAVKELISRIRALGRRPKELIENKNITINDTTLDGLNMKLIAHDKSCNLTPKEMKLFELLFKKVSQTVSREILINTVWGPQADIEMGNVDNYIHFLRKRLNSIESSLSIKTVYGVGYQLEENR